MHELSLSRAVTDTAVRHASGRKVTAVTVRIGHLRQVVPQSLAFYFQLVSRGTLCEGAHLEMVSVPAVMRCQACGREWEPQHSFRCVCGDAGDVVAGDELEVESIEVEEVACTGSG